MDFTAGDTVALSELCRLGRFDGLIEEYIYFCRGGVGEATANDSVSSKKGSHDTRSTAFPNLAGFCRYTGVGEEELWTVLSEFPECRQRLMAVLEDEALNSAVSPTIVSAYLKRRLGYEKSTSAKPEGAQISIQFEHDIYEDGE